MSWFWISVPLAAVFFLATAGIPMWLVLRRPEAREPAVVRATRVPPETVAGRYAASRADTAPRWRADSASMSRD